MIQALRDYSRVLGGYPFLSTFVIFTKSDWGLTPKQILSVHCSFIHLFVPSTNFNKHLSFGAVALKFAFPKESINQGWQEDVTWIGTENQFVYSTKFKRKLMYAVWCQVLGAGARKGKTVMASVLSEFCKVPWGLRVGMRTVRRTGVTERGFAFGLRHTRISGLRELWNFL